MIVARAGKTGTAAATLRMMLAERGPGKTLCPSEVARGLARDDGDWRSRMNEVHAVVDAMLAEGTVCLSWKGKRLRTREGPYRIGSPNER